MFWLEKLVENGKIPESFIDESAFRVLIMKNQLGLFENPFAGLGKSEKLTPYHRAKAYELTSESCVLLKNEKILPLCQKQRVIWAGPYVTSKEFLSRWSIFGEHEAVETIEDILQKKQIKAECIPGCRMLSDEECKIWQVEPERFDEPGNERWLETITGDDTVVCVLGEHESQSGEAASRAFLTLPEEQQLFFERIAKRTRNIVTVVITGRPLDLRRISEKSRAVIMAWRPGTMGAEAVVDIVYGRTNPSGKLAVSIPWCVGQVPVSYWDIKTGHIYDADHIRELEGDERREIIRILTEFSNVLRPSIPEILQSYEFLAEIDFIRAKSYFAIQTNSLKPAVENEQLLDWTMAVHPLLQLSLAKHGKKVVPLDIELNQKQRILIISGPNAGGKSVCLKTVGLLQYMLQCGMLIPLHERSHAGIFSSIFIDIGDEQSIEDDLSTYSSHLTNMKIMMKSCNERSLILIDEFGGGTEPQIGGAIAEAVLKRFNQKGTFGVITTHYQNLKHFAEDHEGVVNGAMLYDRHLMQALFQLQIGNPGSSFAVEIARKIGLPEDVIADASEIVGSEYINADKYLQDIVRDKRYWEGKRQTIRQREKHMEETIARYQTEMEELQKSRKEIIRQAKEEAERMLQESNARIENTIRTIKEAQAEKEKTRQARQELTDFRTSLDALASKEHEEKIAQKMEKLKEKQERKKNKKSEPKAAVSSPSSAPKIVPIAVGENVKIKGQTSVGQVMEISGKNATVAFGSIKTTVKIDRLERANHTPKTEGIAKSTFVSSQTHDQMYEKKLSFKQDIDVRGMRGDEALQAVTYFIDDAILVGMDRVRILHGTGTGILRTLIRQYLATVPGVSHYADEHVQFGGAGITVVDFD